MNKFTMTVYRGFEKKENSTELPSGAGYDIEFVPYKSFSVENPVIIISQDENAINASYAYIADFERYYFIDSYELMGGGLWKLTLSTDVMGTWREAIGNTSAWVQRANYGTKAIPDTYTNNGEYAVKTATGSTLFPGTNFYYVVGVKGRGITGRGNSTGNTCYYGMSSAQLATLCRQLWTAETEALSGISLTNYITMVRPTLEPLTGASVEQIYIGGRAVPASGALLPCNYTPTERTFRITIPTHPSQGEYGGWFSAEYGSYVLNLGALGIHAIDGHALIKADGNLYSNLTVTVLDNVFTGIVTVDVKPTGSNISLVRQSASIFKELKINCKHSDELTDSLAGLTEAGAEDIGHIIDTVIASTPALANLNVKNGTTFGDVASDFLVTVASKYLKQSISSFGSGSGTMYYQNFTPTLTYRYNNVIEKLANYDGFPVNQVQKINHGTTGNPGLRVCSNVRLYPSKATRNECIKLNKILNGRFYYK